MKYVGRILMAIILLLLTACGTPAAEVSTKPGQHTGTVQMEDGTDSSAVSGQLDYIPPMDFTPSSAWMAAPFGGGGQALLYTGAEENGAIPFKIFTACKRYMYTDDPYHVLSMDCRSFSGEFIIDGRYFSFTASFDSEAGGPAGPHSVSGTAEIDADVLTISYTDASPRYENQRLTKNLEAEPSIICSLGELDANTFELHLPYSFIRLSDEQIGSAMYQMPVFTEEIESGELRGIEVGSSIADILFRIPRRDEYRPWDEISMDVLCIYGAGAMNWFGALISVDEEGVYRVVVQAYEIITYVLDEDFKVSSVEHYKQSLS